MLKHNEVRRLIAHLQKHIDDELLLAQIEDNLFSEDGNEIIREPEFLQYFSQTIIALLINKTVWTLKIIPYTYLRMVQRGIGQQQIAEIFTRFVEVCDSKSETIIVGSYTILINRLLCESTLMKFQMKRVLLIRSRFLLEKETKKTRFR